MEKLFRCLLQTSNRRDTVECRLSYYTTVGKILQVAPCYFALFSSTVLDMIDEMMLYLMNLLGHCVKVNEAFNYFRVVGKESLTRTSKNLLIPGTLTYFYLFLGLSAFVQTTLTTK
jgi:hypothetical protein